MEIQCVHASHVMDYSTQTDYIQSHFGVKGCKTCRGNTDVKVLYRPEGNLNINNAFEFEGAILQDQLCLLLDPKDSNCV
jgi:hypothetical protein